MTRTRKKAVVGNVAAPALLSDITKLGGGIDPKEKNLIFLKEMNYQKTNSRMKKICINPSKRRKISAATILHTYNNVNVVQLQLGQKSFVFCFFVFPLLDLNELYRKIIPVYDLELLYQLY